MSNRLRRGFAAALCALAVTGAPIATADPYGSPVGGNSRLNWYVYAGVYKLQRDHGCFTTLKVNPKLRLAAQWHANDVANNLAIDGDIGSDGSTVQDRARNAGYNGVASETVAIVPSLAINNLQVINQWYYRADYFTIMSDCSNWEIGVWSENRLDRSVVVAVYGKGEN